MSVRVLVGHVLDVLASLEPGQFHVCVTSPPYLWLRSYSTEPQTWPDGWVGELGQEPDPETYVAHLVECFRAVRRVLRDDGTLWVNLAGCYFNDPGGQKGTTGNVSAKAIAANGQQGRQQRGRHPWLKALDWVDVPGLFARAMQQDGWYWRSDVTWVKPSALPESVSGTRWERCKTKTVPSQVLPGYRTDRPHEEPSQQYGVGSRPNAEWADCPGCPRCAATGGYVLRRGNGRPTKSTERVLVFAKRPGYYWDQEAVRENLAEATIADGRTARGQRGTKGEYGAVDGNCGFDPTRGRNLRDFWVISPEPISDQHYAAFPTRLPDRCIRAGTSEWGCCPACGAPWARVVARSVHFEGGSGRAGNTPDGKWAGTEQAVSGEYDIRKGPVVDSTTLGWRPTCRCPEQPPVPCRVLDPFGGSGATALAANRLGRDATLVELKPAYAALARRRIGREPLSLFASPAEAVVEGVP